MTRSVRAVPPSPRRLVALLALTLALALTTAACGDDGGPSGPGELSAVVVSPNGPEGAAVVRVSGKAVVGAQAFEGEGQVFSAQPDSLTTGVVVVRNAPGTLRFRLQVRDRGAPPPAAILLQVSDPDNRLRPSLAGYKVQFER